MHKAIIEIVDPDNVEMQLTIRAKTKTLLKVRRALNGALGEQYDHSLQEFLESISEAIGIVDKKFVGMSSISGDDRADDPGP